jgi:hypothetical protein
MRGCQESIPRTKSHLTVISKLNSIYSCRRIHAFVTRIIVAFLVNTACGVDIELIIEQEYYSH